MLHFPPRSAPAKSMRGIPAVPWVAVFFLVRSRDANARAAPGKVVSGTSLMLGFGFVAILVWSCSALSTSSEFLYLPRVPLFFSSQLILPKGRQCTRRTRRAGPLWAEPLFAVRTHCNATRRCALVCGRVCVLVCVCEGGAGHARVCVWFPQAHTIRAHYVTGLPIQHHAIHIHSGKLKRRAIWIDLQQIGEV